MAQRWLPGFLRHGSRTLGSLRINQSSPYGLIQHGNHGGHLKQPHHHHRGTHSNAADLRQSYKKARAWLTSKKLPPNIETFGVFCNDQTDLDEVDVYGFDYDYTLAAYKKGVEYLIHDIAREHLVKKYGYPEEVGKIVYDPNFAIRGLHYDVENGLFLKVDNAHLIQFGTVHRGKVKLSNEEVLAIYRRRQLPVSALESISLGGGSNEAVWKRKVKMVQLNDIFSKPEMNLIAEVIHFCVAWCKQAYYIDKVMDLFMAQGLSFEPESLHYDVAKCIGAAHATFHAETRANPGLFMHR